MAAPVHEMDVQAAGRHEQWMKRSMGCERASTDLGERPVMNFYKGVGSAKLWLQLNTNTSYLRYVASGQHASWLMSPLATRLISVRGKFAEVFTA